MIIYNLFTILAPTVIELQDKIQKLLQENNELRNRDSKTLQTLTQDNIPQSPRKQEIKNLKYELDHKTNELEFFLKQNEQIKKDIEEQSLELEELKNEKKDMEFILKVL